MGQRGGLRAIYFYWVRGLVFWLFTLRDEIARNDLSKRGQCWRSRVFRPLFCGRDKRNPMGYAATASG